VQVDIYNNIFLNEIMASTNLYKENELSENLKQVI